ncbi:hypothetical protein EDC96DRAFT_500443 [Choanephora cucurbitarum]|nr:hypothetical protein EDC96DRAFT_500443 [Choanephora cucurbitarum]
MSTNKPWNEKLSSFFKEIGLVETGECLESELVVLSREQLERLPAALESLVERLLESLEHHIEAKEQLIDQPDATHADLLVQKRKRPRTEDQEKQFKEEEEKERTKRLNGEQVQIRATSGEVKQRITTFIQAKRNELDESNRTEFLSRHDLTTDDVTCARTDAREINRNIQMKFDVVNNEDGPLARSLQVHHQKQTSSTDPNIPDMSERLQNLQDHLNVKIDTTAKPPFTVHERIKILENTLMEIERQYPKWAAVHLNQPNRAFPPPPPVTYITRPRNDEEKEEQAYTATQINSIAPQHTTTLKAHGRANSSLTRAVIDQLNRQKQVSFPS